MTQARNRLICLDSTPYYHCIVRCVRESFLCGHDRVSDRDFTHRRQWLVTRLRFLAHVFSVDICAYAIMSNHYHVILRLDPDTAKTWSADDVVSRWKQLYKSHILVDQWFSEPSKCPPGVQQKAQEIIEKWRARLCDLSWFMRCVNENIARMANREDQCTGRFWAGRFKSQALLDDAAILSCMTYVDLNPIRAKLADDLESSDFTSIQQRLHEYNQDDNKTSESRKKLQQHINKQNKAKVKLKLDHLPIAPLMSLLGKSTDVNREKPVLPFTYQDYFELVDLTGRIMREDKRGFIKDKCPSILSRLNIDPDRWIDHIQKLNFYYGQCIGSCENIHAFTGKFERHWGKGLGQSAQFYKESTPPSAE